MRILERLLPMALSVAFAVFLVGQDECQPDGDGDGVTLWEGDCNDSDPSVYPEAPELCDGVDNDCDGVVPADELDVDVDGAMICDGDCDDRDPEVYPNAQDVCDSKDNDCDGTLDEGYSWYPDRDGDGYGEYGAPPVESCLEPPGHTMSGGDCDDSDPTVFPGGGDFRYAPAPLYLNGQGIVPIDIEQLEATVLLDGRAGEALAEADVFFQMGTDGGFPYFDLRQRILEASLDGTPVAPSRFVRQDFGGGPDAEMLTLQIDLEACSTHRLRLSYDLNEPMSPETQPIDWDLESTAVSWDFWFTDLEPGRYLEQWFPANLLHDRIPFNLELLLESDLEHTMITNAVTTELGPGWWRLEFPAHFTAFSPLFVLVPSTDVSFQVEQVALSNGQQVDVALYRENSVAQSLETLHGALAEYLEAFVSSIGAYAHGDRLVAFVWDNYSRAMEYDGGLTTYPGALDHETFHSWYGRGVKPARGADGWMDEAWDSYYVDSSPPLYAEPLDPEAPPVQLCTDNPFSRTTPGESYGDGADFFGHMAYLMGTDVLVEAMNRFYRDRALELFTTDELEAYLYCLSGDPEVLYAFHRFVYGLDGMPDEDDLPECPVSLSY